MKNEAVIPLKTFFGKSRSREEVEIRWQWSDIAHMTRNHPILRLVWDHSKIWRVGQNKFTNQFSIMLIVSEGPKFHHSCSYNNNLFLCKKCVFLCLASCTKTSLLKDFILGLGILFTRTTWITFLSHEMTLQCIGSLDFNFNGIG